MNKIILEKKGYKIIDDEKVGYIHIDPIPTDKEIEKIYSTEYYTQDKKDYIDNTQEDLDWWETTYNDRFEIFDKYSEKSKKILDIGCGSGYFLNYGKEQGWDCYGVEPSKVAATHAINMGLNIINQVYTETMYKKSIFDVIHMQDVLEHINHPINLLSQVHNNLKPGGILCICVPNEFSPLQKILWESLEFEPWWVVPPHHINYFTPSSLKTILLQAGFDIFLEESTFPMELFLLMGDDYITEPALGRKMHLKRKNFDLNMSKYDNKLKRDLYKSLAKLNIGREIIIYARKK